MINRIIGVYFLPNVIIFGQLLCVCRWGFEQWCHLHKYVGGSIKQVFVSSSFSSAFDILLCTHGSVHISDFKASLSDFRISQQKLHSEP